MTAGRLPFPPSVEIHVGRRTAWVYTTKGHTRAVVSRCPKRQWCPAERCWMVPAQAAHDLAQSLRRARFTVDLIEVSR